MTTVLTGPARVGLLKYCPPAEGSAAYPITVDFTAETTFEVNLQNLQAGGQISQLEGVYIDNADNPDPLLVMVQGTGQRIICPPFSQGYFVVLAPNPPAIIIESAMAAVVCQVILLNFTVMPVVWGAGTGP